MTTADALPSSVLRRRAVVYVRQSSQSQVQTNLESKRRQYDLVEVARQHGFHDIEVIDDDLGRSASGTVARPGFERLVAWLCAGDVGAELCFDASRLARNGRDWHHLLELCGLVEARVIDMEGVYDPCRPNDRLILGMKGSISQFELGTMRARMLDAARQKARRGELRISVPFGYLWHREVGLGLDPDLRMQEVIRLVFTRFGECGSARQGAVADDGGRRPLPAPVRRQANDRPGVVPYLTSPDRLTMADIGRASLEQACQRCRFEGRGPCFADIVQAGVCYGPGTGLLGLNQSNPPLDGYRAGAGSEQPLERTMSPTEAPMFSRSDGFARSHSAGVL